MAYSIKQLAQLSGISTRTLRFYDEIGLLKPAYYGENKYRFYEEEQLLLLQQILFYRELDFSLQDIQAVLNNSTVDKISMLQVQKSLFQDKLYRINSMLKTLDNTILHLRGEVAMQVEKFFEQSHLRNACNQKEYEMYLIGKGILSREEMDASWKKLEAWTQADWKNFNGDGDKFYRQMADAVNSLLDPGGIQVQELVHQHYLLIKPLWSFNQASYSKLADSYLVNQDFFKFCDLYHPKLHQFIVKAMHYYAKHQLV